MLFSCCANQLTGFYIMATLALNGLRFGKYLPRTLLQWGSLESYFLSNLNFNNDSFVNNPHEKLSREKRLVNAFKQSVSKLYAILSSLYFQYLTVLTPFCKPRNHWFTCSIILLCVCIAHYFQDLSYSKLSQN